MTKKEIDLLPLGRKLDASVCREIFGLCPHPVPDLVYGISSDGFEESWDCPECGDHIEFDDCYRSSGFYGCRFYSTDLNHSQYIIDHLRRLEYSFQLETSSDLARFSFWKRDIHGIFTKDLEFYLDPNYICEGICKSALLLMSKSL